MSHSSKTISISAGLCKQIIGKQIIGKQIIGKQIIGKQKGFSLVETMGAIAIVAFGLAFAFYAYLGADQASKITTVKENVVFIVTAARKLKTSNTNTTQYKYNGQPITLSLLKSFNYLPANFPVPNLNDQIQIQDVTYSISTGTSATTASVSGEPDIYLNVQVAGLNGNCDLLIKSLNDYKVSVIFVNDKTGLDVNSISCNSSNSVFNIWFE